MTRRPVRDAFIAGFVSASGAALTLERLREVREMLRAFELPDELLLPDPESEPRAMADALAERVLEGPRPLAEDPRPPPKPVKAQSFDEWLRKTGALLEENEERRVARLAQGDGDA